MGNTIRTDRYALTGLTYMAQVMNAHKTELTQSVKCGHLVATYLIISSFFNDFLARKPAQFKSSWVDVDCE